MWFGVKRCFSSSPSCPCYELPLTSGFAVVFLNTCDKHPTTQQLLTPGGRTYPRFACADQNFDVSMSGQIRFMKEVVPWLEQEDLIEKYAWFSCAAAIVGFWWVCPLMQNSNIKPLSNSWWLHDVTCCFCLCLNDVWLIRTGVETRAFPVEPFSWMFPGKHKHSHLEFNVLFVDMGSRCN